MININSIWAKVRKNYLCLKIEEFDFTEFKLLKVCRLYCENSESVEKL